MKSLLSETILILSLLSIHSALLSRSSVQDQESSLSNFRSDHTSNNTINTIYIPFTMAGQLILVDAIADSTYGKFILDTGSERLVLNSKHFAPSGKGESIVSTGNTGLVASVTGESIAHLYIGSMIFKNQFAHIIDLEHIELKKHTRIIGILGFEVFKNFELFIDFQQQMIALYRLDRVGNRIDTYTKSEVPTDSLRFEQIKHLILVPVEINKVRLKMILDSGAELSLIDRHINRKVLDHFTIIQRVNMVGVGQSKVEVLAGILTDVHCSDQIEKRMNTLLTSLDEINAAFEIQADGVIGFEFFKTRRTLINYTTRTIYFFDPIRSS